MNHFKSLDTKRRSTRFLATRNSYMSSIRSELGLRDIIKDDYTGTINVDLLETMSIGGVGIAYGTKNADIDLELSNNRYVKEECTYSQYDRFEAEPGYSNILTDDMLYDDSYTFS
jgi:hypothetical protein